MSSHVSPMSAAGRDDALFVAFLTVCEKSFFTFVDACDPAEFGQVLTNARDAHWLKASVSYEGTESSGTLDVFLPETLGRWLVATLLGLPREGESEAVEIDGAQVSDGVGEFANMICGAWLTDVKDQAFNLSPPVVSQLSAGQVAELNGQGDGLRLRINDLPVRVLVTSSTD